jgi:hypothetical protein
VSAAVTAISTNVPARHRVATRRRIASAVVLTLLMLGTFLAVALLVTILGYVIFRGLPALNIDFFTQRPLPVGEAGGLRRHRAPDRDRRGDLRGRVPVRPFRGAGALRR